VHPLTILFVLFYRFGNWKHSQWFCFAADVQMLPVIFIILGLNYKTFKSRRQNKTNFMCDVCMHQLRILVLGQNIVTLVHNGAKTSCGFLPCGSFFRSCAMNSSRFKNMMWILYGHTFFRIPVDLDLIRLPAVEQNLKGAFDRAPAVTMVASAMAVPVEWILCRSWSRLKKRLAKQILLTV
jgi:hypothetical protein